MVKHTQTIRRQFANELFECVWPFSEIGALRVKLIWVWVFIVLQTILDNLLDEGIQQME